MAKCNKCLHGDVCFTVLDSMQCQHFKDRSRFVELPCKVGDTVYCLAKPLKRRITKISITTYGLRLSVNDMFCFDESQIGKTVFFTKEQAEQALKERENK